MVALRELPVQWEQTLPWAHGPSSLLEVTVPPRGSLCGCTLQIEPIVILELPPGWSDARSLDGVRHVLFLKPLVFWCMEGVGDATGSEARAVGCRWGQPGLWVQPGLLSLPLSDVGKPQHQSRDGCAVWQGLELEQVRTETQLTKPSEPLPPPLASLACLRQLC